MGEGKKLTDNLVLKTLKTHVLNMIQLALKVLKLVCQHPKEISSLS